MGFGWCGRILHVNLTTSRIEVEEPPEAFYRTWLGGKALAARYLYRGVPAGSDPLGPENRLVITTGVCAGVPLPGFSRFLMAAKSPLTKAWGQSEAGGYFAPALKRAGFDAVVVDGRADRPVYLAIDSGGARIEDAGFLWGRGTGQTEDLLREHAGDPKARVLSIGPGGERLISFACVLHEKRNAAGRCGLGAVMGAKKLKAVAVGDPPGRRPVPVADPAAVREVANWLAAHFKENTLAFSLYNLGTAGGLAGLNAAGVLPTRNFSSGRFEHWSEITAESFEKHAGAGRWGCFACPVRCKRTVRRPASLADQVAGDTLPGPEYETIAAFGSNLGLADRDTIIHANRLCNEAGIDTISAAATIALACEACSRGLGPGGTRGSRVPTPVGDGLDVTFGDGEKIIRALRLLIAREGPGDLLARGSTFLSRHLGLGDLAMEVKGLELPMHDPRGKAGVGLGYAVASHGADHMVAAHDSLFAAPGSPGLQSAGILGLAGPVDPLALDAAKVRHFLHLERWWEALQTLSVCLFVPAPRGALPVEMVLKALAGVTGWDMSLEELLEAGARGTDLARLFNVREGLTRTGDRLPPRLFQDSGEGGHPGLSAADLAQAVATYYALRGWDADGVPGREGLEHGGL